MLNKRKLQQLTTVDLDQTIKQRSILFNPGEHPGYKADKYTNSYAPSQFFTINPLNSTIAARKIKNLVEYRNFLIEFDKKGWSLNRQERWYEQELQLPFATKVYSGGKSLHYIIALTEGVSEDDYKLLFELLTTIITGSDDRVKNPNRLSRTAGQLRDNGVRQELLAVGSRTSLVDLKNRLISIAPVLYEKTVYNFLSNKERIKNRPLRDKNTDYVLPFVFQEILRTGKYQPRYETRHDVLVCAGLAMGYDFVDIETIEQTLYQLQEAMGLHDRNDVPGIVKHVREKLFGG